MGGAHRAAHDRRDVRDAGVTSLVPPHGGAVPGPALTGQFLLVRDAQRVPPSWTTRSTAGWTLGTCDLPVRELVNDAGRAAGWLVGHPVLDGALGNEPVRLHTSDPQRLDWAAVDELLDRLAGRFLLVLLPSDEPTVVLDAYGSLAAVWSSAAQVVASTATLVGGEWNTGLAEVTGFPESATWLPFGLTLLRGVHRLQANHALDLKTWTTNRHWLPPEIRDDLSTEDQAMAVHEGVRSTISAVAAVHPLMLSLTAGRDSRMLLACARDFLDQAAFFTLVSDGPESVDVTLSRQLVSRFSLDHSLVPVRPTDQAALERSLTVTGHAVGGELWRAHDSLEQLDGARVLLPGTAGEVGRAHTWRPGDPDTGTVSPELLLRRLRLPALEVYLEGAHDWLASLPELPHATVLELAYIEQRLSCWAGPGHYGNRTSRFELPPFAGRALFTTMLSLPLAYRHAEGLTTDICRHAWPELLDVPFNRFTGLRGIRATAGRAARKVARTVRSTARPQ
ncbi:MAG: hypothetical protein JWO76_3115 [Nocardioides sp.]|nr:hypothetical protein [Nocardioides sp.]